MDISLMLSMARTGRLVATLIRELSEQDEAVGKRKPVPLRELISEVRLNLSLLQAVRFGQTTRADDPAYQTVAACLQHVVLTALVSDQRAAAEVLKLGPDVVFSLRRDAVPFEAELARLERSVAETATLAQLYEPGVGEAWRRLNFRTRLSNLRRRYRVLLEILEQD